MTFELRTVPLDGAREHVGVLRFCKIATPETAGSAQYFMSITRDFAPDPTVDGAFSARRLDVVRSDDSPMQEAVDREMKGRDLLTMPSVILPTDAGALAVRGVTSRLIRPAETSPELLCPISRHRSCTE